MVRSLSALSVAIGLLLSATMVSAATPGASEEPGGSLAPTTGSASDVGWTRATLTQPTDDVLSDALVVGVTAGPDGYVAVGQRVCAEPRGARSRCWGQAWTSADGASWTTIDPRTSGLDLGISLPVLSGPEVGLAGVAHGPAGFLAFGRAGDRPKGRQTTAVWRSDDGRSWERVTARKAFPRGTRLRTILGVADGYLLGGVIYRKGAPKAAIWSSSDGRAWTLARGRDAFDIGGYIDTMEDPGSGGINAFSPYPAPVDGPASLDAGVVAVGQACVGRADRSIFAWNAYCWGEVWRAADGLSWNRGDGGNQTRGASSSVAAVGERIIADAPICFGGCPSAILASDDATTWHVAYGSPVEGELMGLAAAGGRFFAVLATPGPEGRSTLVFWISDDGSGWRLANAQPMLPAEGMSFFHHVDMTVAGDRVLVTASGEPGADTFESFVLLSPPVANMG